MNATEWGALITTVVASLAGAIVLIVKAYRPEPKKKGGQDRHLPIAPPPAPVTHADLAALRSELKELVDATEDALRARLDDRMRELVDRLHSLAVRVERAIALEERESQPSRRGGRR